MTATGDARARPSLSPGTRVEVRNGFDWSSGFAVEVHDGDGYRIRRRSDGSVLPVTFEAGDVRRERRSSMWWV